MTQKMRQKRLPSYINNFISNRRKINSKKELCGALHLDMLFSTKKKLKIFDEPGMRNIHQEIGGF